VSDWWKDFCENDNQKRVADLTQENERLKAECDSIDLSKIRVETAEYPESNEHCSRL
jgi:hypothetical protein